MNASRSPIRRSCGAIPGGWNDATPPAVRKGSRRSSQLCAQPCVGCAGGGSGGVGGRWRSSVMNWSNSALSLAKRSRSRKAPNSFCSSSRRRSVSIRYSSKARLPLVGAGRSPPPHQFFQPAHGGAFALPGTALVAAMTIITPASHTSAP